MLFGINKHYKLYRNKENLYIFSSANSIHLPTYSTIFPISLICSLFPHKLTHSKPWKTYKGKCLRRKFPFRRGQMNKVPSISYFQTASHYIGIKLLLRNKWCRNNALDVQLIPFGHLNVNSFLGIVASNKCQLIVSGRNTIPLTFP